MPDATILDPELQAAHDRLMEALRPEIDAIYDAALAFERALKESGEPKMVIGSVRFGILLGMVSGTVNHNYPPDERLPVKAALAKVLLDTENVDIENGDDDA